MLYSPVTIHTHHEEIIHDISFDQSGKRFATCSSDQTVKIYGLGHDGKWIKQDEIKTHDGPVWKVKWASPRFGTVIATCSQDKSVCIWEEITTPTGDKKWEKRDKIIDTRESVQDISFSTNKVELTLAIASADGNLLFYELVENHSQHQNKGEIMANNYGIKSISWSKGLSNEQSFIVVGGNCYEDRFYKLTQNQVVMKQASNNRIPGFNANVNQAVIEKDQKRKTLTIFGTQENKQSLWIPIKNFEQEQTVYDVSWANLMGRSFHLLGIADCTGVKVWKLRVKQNQVEILEHMNIDQLSRPAFRVSWNLTATMFAATYDKQELMVFKNVNNNWVCQATIQEQQEKQELV